MSAPRGRLATRLGGLARRVAASGVLLALPAVAPADQTSDFFRGNCASCHTIGGGRLTGPDLKGVTGRKDRAWLEKFVQNPKAIIDGGDPYALELQREARGVVMPTIPGVTPDRAKALLSLIEEHSSLARSPFGGQGITDRPFVAADVELGTQLFLGARPFVNGGPACASCHTLATLGGLGGGRLGPDLTRVYQRLGDRKAVGAWLAAPVTATMQGVFRQHALEPEEILGLLAVVEDAARRGAPSPPAPGPGFFLLGFAGMVVSLAALGKAWSWRFRAVRRPLVHCRTRGDA